jgi:hypothetical protein
MPRGTEHDRLTLALIGYNIPQVHRVLDYAVRVIGPSHQIVMHDIRALDAIEILFGVEGRVVACVHIMHDLNILSRR